MFADYVYQTSNPLGGEWGTDVDDLSSALPSNLFPQLCRPVLWGRGGNSGSCLEEDFLMIAEFSEIEGPRPLILIPAEGGRSMDLNSFVLKIMAVDNQTSTQNFTICQDWQVVNTDVEEGIFAFVHHIILNDIQARGYVRPFCIAYITNTERKIMNFLKEISESFHKVARSLKYGNRLVFTRDLQNYVLDLEHTLNHMKRVSQELLEQIPGAETKMEGTGECTDIEALQTALKEAREILSVVRALQQDQRLDTRFQTLEGRAHERSHAQTVVEEGVPHSFPQRATLQDQTPDLPIKASSLGDESEGGALLFDSTQKHMACLVDLKRQKKFDDPLRGFHDLCSWGAKEGLKKLRCIQEHFKRDLVFLELERSEYELLDPSSSLLTCGQCVTANFLSGVSMSDAPFLRHYPSLDTLDSYKSVASFLSAQSFESLASAQSFSGLNSEDQGQIRYGSATATFSPNVSPKDTCERDVSDLRGKVLQPVRDHAESSVSEAMERHRSVSEVTAKMDALAVSNHCVTEEKAAGAGGGEGGGESSMEGSLETALQPQRDGEDSLSSSMSTEGSRCREGSQTSAKESSASDGSGVNPAVLSKTSRGFASNGHSRSPTPISSSSNDSSFGRSGPQRNFGNATATALLGSDDSSGAEKGDENSDKVDGNSLDQESTGIQGEVQDDADRTEGVDADGSDLIVPRSKNHTSMLSKTISEMEKAQMHSPASNAAVNANIASKQIPGVPPSGMQKRIHVNVHSTILTSQDRMTALTLEQKIEPREVSLSLNTFSLTSEESSASGNTLTFHQTGGIHSPEHCVRTEMKRMNSYPRPGKEEIYSSLSLSSSLDAGTGPGGSAKCSGVQNNGFAETPCSAKTLSCSSPSKKSRCGFNNLGDLLFNFGSQTAGSGLLRALCTYPGLQHAIHSLLTGRPVLVVGPPSHEHDVIRLVTALAVFVPDSRRKSQSIVEWQSRPLRIADLTRLRLVGVCRPNRRSLDCVIPRIVRSYSSLIDVEKKITIAPLYEGTQITNLTSKRKILKSDEELVTLVHCWLMELSLKAFIFYHSFCLGTAGTMLHHGNLMQQQQQYQSTVRSLLVKLAIHPGDVQIIEYLTEVVKMSQVESSHRQSLEPGAFIPPLFLSHKQCQTFRGGS